MAEIWGAAIVAGAAVAGSAMQANAAKKGAAAQTNAANAATAETARQYDLAREDQRPFLEAGQNAVNLQQRYLAGDTSGFDQSPDYQFAVQQGTKQLDAGAASRGNLWGGGADADRIQLGQGLATQYANNYWNKLAGMAGQGQQSANTLGGLGANAAGQTGQYLTNAGQATASSYAGQANAYGDAIGQLGNIAGQYYGYDQGYGGTPASTNNLGNTSGNWWSQFGNGSGNNFNIASMGTG